MLDIGPTSGVFSPTDAPQIATHAEAAPFRIVHLEL